MNRWSSRRLLPWVLLFPLLIASFACGIKAPPTPSRLLLPGRVRDMTYAFDDQGRINVSFSPPQDTVDGRPLTDLGAFLVTVADNELTPDYCPGCPARYDEFARFDAVPGSKRTSIADTRYRFAMPLEAGHAYRYRIYALNRRGDYAPDTFTDLQVFYDSPVRPPETVTAVGEGPVTFVSWNPPDSLLDGRPVEGLLGYDLYRRADGEESFQKLNPDRPLQRAAFEDTLAKPGKTYAYQVRSVRDFMGTIIAGPPSTLEDVRPVDLTPPPPPVNVYAASTPEGVKVTWPAVETTETVGYRLYRRPAGASRYERIGPELINDNLFLDTHVSRGREYAYRVTSVDDATPPNESPPSQETRIRYEP